MEGAPWLTVGGRTWLDDADRFGRRLAVHAHPERGWITLSFWEADECRATFHLRRADASHLIYRLAEGLAGAPDLNPGPSRPYRPSVVEAGVRLMGHGARWLARRTGLGRLGPEPGAEAPSGAPRLRVVADPGSQPDPSSG